MPNSVINQGEEKMKKSIEVLKKNLQKFVPDKLIRQSLTQ